MYINIALRVHFGFPYSRASGDARTFEVLVRVPSLFRLPLLCIYSLPVYLQQIIHLLDSVLCDLYYVNRLKFVLTARIK